MADEPKWMYEVSRCDVIGRYEVVKVTDKTVTVLGDRWRGENRERRRRLCATSYESPAFFSVDEAILWIKKRHTELYLHTLKKHNVEVAWESNCADWEAETRAKFADSEPQG